MAATFVDANVFVYAFLKTKRKLQPQEESIKKAAKEIIARINSGEEEAVTSVVHFCGVCNILENYLPVADTLELEKALLFTDSILIKQVSDEDYIKALTIAEDQQIGVNDALAYFLMKELGLNKIYSFDTDFDCFKDIDRLTK